MRSASRRRLEGLAVGCGNDVARRRYAPLQPMVAAHCPHWICIRRRVAFARRPARTTLVMGVTSSLAVGSLVAVGLHGGKLGALALGFGGLAHLSVAGIPTDRAWRRIDKGPRDNCSFSGLGALSRGIGTDQISFRPPLWSPPTPDRIQMSFALTSCYRKTRIYLDPKAM